MMDFYILWTYKANYNERPVRIRARSAKEAVKDFAAFYSEDFKKHATVYAFTEAPIGVWRNGNFAEEKEVNF